MRRNEVKRTKTKAWLSGYRIDRGAGYAERLRRARGHIVRVSQGTFARGATYDGS